MAIKFYDARNYVRLLIERSVQASSTRHIYEMVQADTDASVFVWDGAGGNKLRRAKYPEYKMNRTPPRNEVMEELNAVKEILSLSRALQVEVPGYEADDVIATLARSYAAGGQKVLIMSNDFDFMQLTAEYPKRIFVGAKPKDGIEPDMVRYYKTMVGDPSDNIPGVQGFGKKSWDETPKADIKAFVDAIVLGKPVPELNVAKRCKLDPERIKLFYDITGLYDVPTELIDQHFHPGRNNRTEAESYLKRYFL